MRIESIRALPGPNVYLPRPVLTAGLAISEAEHDLASRPKFIGRLQPLLDGVGLESSDSIQAALHSRHAIVRMLEEVVRRLHGLLGIKTSRCQRRLTNDAAVSQLAVGPNRPEVADTQPSVLQLEESQS